MQIKIFSILPGVDALERVAPFGPCTRSLAVLAGASNKLVCGRPGASNSKEHVFFHSHVRFCCKLTGEGT